METLRQLGHRTPTPLLGRVALVTGSGRGIGAGIARAFAAAGADVVINDLPESAGAAEVSAAIGSAGRRSAFVAADVAVEQQVVAMFAAIDEKFGGIDILVNNAGIVRHEDIFRTSLDSWRSVIDTHLTGAFLCSREAMTRMRERGRGRIIQISSVVAHQGAIHGFVHYAAAKSGLLGFTRTLARTSAPFGITVNAIAPGVVDSEMLRSTHGDRGVAEFASTVPLGLSTVDDIGAAAVFLASDDAQRITGAVLDVNGGMYFH